MKEIKLSGPHGTEVTGMVVIVDDEDYEELNKYTWQANCRYSNKNKTGKYFYARRSTNSKKLDNGKWLNKTIYMHRYLTKTSPEQPFVDHVNRNTLDNRRCNLRAASRSENGINRVSKKKYKGIYKFIYKKDGKIYETWQIVVSKQLQDGTKKKYVRYNKSEEEAVKIYNEMASKYQGEFAILNKIENNE